MARWQDDPKAHDEFADGLRRTRELYRDARARVDANLRELATNREDTMPAPRLANEIIIDHQTHRVTIDGEVFPYHLWDQAPQARVQQGVVIVQLGIFANSATVISPDGIEMTL